MSLSRISNPVVKKEEERRIAQARAKISIVDTLNPNTSTQWLFTKRGQTITKMVE